LLLLKPVAKATGVRLYIDGMAARLTSLVG